jgi:uncharacterized protein DUF3551
MTKEAIMRAISLISVTLATLALGATNAAAGSYCATYSDQKGGSENCTFTSLAQCQAQVSGLGGWCRANPFPGTAFGTSSGSWGHSLPQGGGY